MAKSRSRLALVLALIVLIVLIAEGLLIAAVTISPTANRSLSDRLARFQEDWEGTDERPGIPDRFKSSAERFYDEHVETLWAPPEIGGAETTFAACGTCHEDYETEKRFSAVYMDHPLHAQEGLSCGECHTQNTHPNPSRPTEDVCAECHDVQERKKCDTCHPPGGLAHFYLLGAPREGVPECTVCHPSESFEREGPPVPMDTGAFNGDDRRPCEQCHVAQSTCESCHGTPKVGPHPANWVAQHAEAALSNDTCTVGCHTGNWCYARCHYTVPKIPLNGYSPTVPITDESGESVPG